MNAIPCEGTYLPLAKQILRDLLPGPGYADLRKRAHKGLRPAAPYDTKDLIVRMCCNAAQCGMMNEDMFTELLDELNL